MSDLHDPAPDDALASALAALGPAADAAIRAIELAAASGDWAAALAAIEALASASADALEGSLYAALLAGGARVVSALPPGVQGQGETGSSAFPPGLVEQQLASLPPEMRPLFLEAMGRAPAPIADTPEALPLAQRAAEALRSRRLVTADQMRTLSEDAKSRALIVAGVVRQQAMVALQPLLEEQALAPSLASFRRRLREEGLADAIAGRHVETAFRDAVQTAYADGIDRLLDDPLVGEAFPYVERLPIKDSRLSRVCAWASRAGLNGTGIYRRDDPAWRLVRPPTHHNCRCGVNPLTREMAAAKGILAGRDVTLPDGLIALLKR
jgi:hypothetical protein